MTLEQTIVMHGEAPPKGARNVVYRLPGGESDRGASMRDKLLRCPQRFAYDYRVMANVKPVSLPTPDPLLIGIEVHEALAHYFARKLHPEVRWISPAHFLTRQEATNAYEQTLKAIPEWLWTAQVLEVEGIAVVWVAASGQVVGPPPDAEERLAVARQRPVQPFATGPYPHTMRTDLVIELPNGKVRVVDWKTTWRVGGQAKLEKHQGFDGNLQFTGLDAWARRKYRSRYDGTFAILAPKPKQARAAVGVLEVTPAIQARLRFGQTVVWSERLLRLLCTGYPDPTAWPAVLSEQGPCKDRYGTCPYIAPCRGAQELA